MAVEAIGRRQRRDVSEIAAHMSDQSGGVKRLKAAILVCRRRFSRHVEMSFGYSFILWTQVARAGDQIDTGLNQTQLMPGGLVGEARPDFTGRASDFWAQGLRFGVVSHF